MGDTRKPASPDDSDLRNKSEHQMIEYATRMRKRAEEAEDENRELWDVLGKISPADAEQLWRHRHGDPNV